MRCKTLSPLCLLKMALARLSGRSDQSSPAGPTPPEASDNIARSGSYDIRIPDMPQASDEEGGRRARRGHRFG